MAQFTINARSDASREKEREKEAKRAVYNNRGTRAKDARSFQGPALCTLLTAVLFNLPLIIVFCPRVYEDRPMIRITRGADYSPLPRPSSLFSHLILSSVSVRKEEEEKEIHFPIHLFSISSILIFNFRKKRSFLLIIEDRF